MAKKALLIGCNYPTEKAELRLRGCINDVWRIRSCLIDRYGFLEEDITVMVDTDPSFTQPTGENIRLALSKLVHSAEPGDELFVHFSGHGFRLEDDTGVHESIVPTDFNLISDYDFKKYAVKVPTDCRLTIVADSCHSGGLIEGAKEQIGESTKKGRSCFGFIMESFNLFRSIPIGIEPHDIHDIEERVCELSYEHYTYVKNRSLPVSTLIDVLKQKTGRDDINLGNLRATLFEIFGEDASPKVKKFGLDTLQDGGGGESGGHGRGFGMVGMPEAYAVLTKSSLLDRGILLSACQSDQEAMEASLCGNSDIVYGAFSNAIQAIIEETDGAVTYRQLVQKAWKVLKRQGFTQKPGLYCSDNNVDAPFLC